MQTLTEQNEARQREIERAQRYETLVTQANALRQRIAGLTTPVVDTSALAKIIKLAEGIPERLLTRGQNDYTPGGFIIRDVIKSAAHDGLVIIERDEADRMARLADAKAKLQPIEEALKDFGE